jgi:hypothetical protein
MTALILKQGVERDRISEVLRQLDLVLKPTTPPEGMFWQLWMTADEGSAVHHIEDSLTNVHSLNVLGKKEELLTRKLREALPVWARDDLLKHALFLLMDGSDEDRRRVAMEVACEMDREYDPASAGVLGAFLEMDEPSTRRAGARAFRTLPWPSLRGTAKDLAADADPEIANLGQEMLARIKELHGE